MTHERLNRRVILEARAKRSPNRRAWFLSSLGSLFERTLIKMMLSMPRATSRAVSVKNAKTISRLSQANSMMMDAVLM